MPISANGFLSRFLLPILDSPNEPGLWTVSIRDRVVGSLICEHGTWRLSWFGDADTRLTSYAGPITGDIDALAEALGLRLGARVSLDALPV